MRHRRRAFTLFQLLVLLAFLLILLALLLPAVQKVRQAAARMQSQNNLKQIGLACHNYHAANGKLPAGADSKNFSALVYLLPYVEQDNVFRNIDLTKGPDDKENATTRALTIKLFLSPLDAVQQPNPNAGANNYFFNAGTKHALEDNDGAFYRESGLRLTDFTDGTSNTMLAVESLKGDGSTTAANVKRQHVRLKKDDLKGLTDAAGVKDFASGKNLAGNRGGAWIDGRFLQTTMTFTRGFNDTRPDVDCGGEGGLSGPRSDYQGTSVLMGDGSVRFINDKVSLDTLKAAATRGGGEVLGPDF